MSILGGQYTLEVPLGESDAGTVWAAHDAAGAKLVVVTLEDDADPKTAERFRAHSAALVSTKHPSIAAAQATGDSESGAPYLVLERVEGVSLATRLIEGPPLTVARVVEIAGLVADGLAAVHAAKIAHGDVEPGNILLSERGGKDLPKLIGFALNRASSRSALARTSLPSLPALAYAAPEQARGEVVDSALADQASLAALVYAALGGRPPHVAKDAAALATAIGSATPPSITAVKKELAPFASTLSRALSSDPAKRFADIGAFARALKTASTMARAIGQSVVPLGVRSPIGEPIIEPKVAPPRPGVGLPGRGLPPAKKQAPAVPPPTATPPLASTEERDPKTEPLERLSDVLIADGPPPVPARALATDEMDLVSLPPSLPPPAPLTPAPVTPPPIPPPVGASAAQAAGADFDESDLVERHSDSGNAPRSVHPPPPPAGPPVPADVTVAPVLAAAPDPEASIVLSPSLEEIVTTGEAQQDAHAAAIAAPQTRPIPPATPAVSKPVLKAPAAPPLPPVAAETLSVQPSESLPLTRPVWLIPAAAAAALVVFGLIAWRALTPSAVTPPPTHRTPVVDLAAIPPPGDPVVPPSDPSSVSPPDLPPTTPPPTPPTPPGQSLVSTPPVHTPPVHAPPVHAPPTHAPVPPHPPAAHPPATHPAVPTPHAPTPRAPHTTAPHTTAPHTTAPRTPAAPTPATTPPRRPTVVSDPGF